MAVIFNLFIKHNIIIFEMQSLIKISASFARMPSIKFLGPRDQIKRDHHLHKTVTPSAPTPAKSPVAALTNGPAVNTFNGLYPNL